MSSTAVTTGYAEVNGLNMYYEIHGSGYPLLLLHGAYMTIGDFGDLLTELAEMRQVIAVELQGHGRTADIDRPFSYPAIADDCAALLGHLGIAQADVYGYSFGAAVACQLAIRHPHLVRRQVVVSVSSRLDGIYPEMLTMLETITPEMMEATPFATAYRAVAPRPDDFPAFVEKLKAFDLEPFDYTDEFASITAPTLLIFGDADIIRPEHAVELLRLLGGGIIGQMDGSSKAQLAILPNTSHIGIMFNPKLILAMVPDFLNAAESVESVATEA